MKSAVYPAYACIAVQPIGFGALKIDTIDRRGIVICIVIPDAHLDSIIITFAP